MISVSDVLRHIQDAAPFLGSDRASISAAHGRILSEDILALTNMPPFAASNMDGYAISGDQSGSILTLIGESAAGHPFDGEVGVGEAVRISTGAMIPRGADRVLIQEDVELRETHIIASHIPAIGTHIRPTGSDFAVGKTLISAGTLLTPANLTLCAAANYAELPLRRRPKVALFSSGDELRRPGIHLESGQIIAANAVGLKSALESWGADVSDLGVVKDDIAQIASLIEGLSNYDIIIPIGGASVGDHDLMQSAFKDTGYNTLFATIAVKPGKPCWMARKDMQIVFGLPGNPASALVCATLFLRPLLGLTNQFQTAFLASAVEENGPRETYLRASIHNQDGQTIATPFPAQDSYRLLPQSRANALIKLSPMAGPFKAGAIVEYLPFGPKF